MQVRYAPCHISKGTTDRRYDFEDMHGIAWGMSDVDASLTLLAHRYRPSCIVRYLNQRWTAPARRADPREASA